MNSSTSSSDPHRRFVVWLLTVVLLSMTGLFVAGVYLQPLDGDLTRLGFFAEREFGWNAPQIEFPDTRLDLPSGLMDPGHFGRYHDVVVLGDSFVWGSPKLQWQNYLLAATDWSVATQNINSVRLHDVLVSPVFRSHPPRILIVESVERELVHHLEENHLKCGGSVLAPPFGLELMPMRLSHVHSIGKASFPAGQRASKGRSDGVMSSPATCGITLRTAWRATCLAIADPIACSCHFLRLRRSPAPTKTPCWFTRMTSTRWKDGARRGPASTAGLTRCAAKSRQTDIPGSS